MRRSIPTRQAVFAFSCAAVLMTACSAPTGPPVVSETATPSLSKAALAPALRSTPRPSAQAEWKTYTTPDGQLAFDYPPDWSVKDRAREAAPGGVFVEVLSGAGKSMATLRTNIQTKPDCPAKYPYALMDSQVLPALKQEGAAPRFIFEGRDDHGSYPTRPASLAYGITSAAPPVGPSACPIFQFFDWGSGLAAFSGVYNPVVVAPGDTPDVDTPEAYTATEEYDEVRQTITSLRPAD